MKKKKDEITIRSSAAEYLTYVASVGDQQDSIGLSKFFRGFRQKFGGQLWGREKIKAKN